MLLNASMCHVLEILSQIASKAIWEVYKSWGSLPSDPLSRHACISHTNIILLPSCPPQLKILYETLMGLFQCHVNLYLASFPGLLPPPTFFVLWFVFSMIHEVEERQAMGKVWEHLLREWCLVNVGGRCPSYILVCINHRVSFLPVLSTVDLINVWDPGYHLSTWWKSLVCYLNMGLAPPPTCLPDISHVIDVPRTSPFFFCSFLATLPLLTIILNANRRTKTGEA